MPISRSQMPRQMYGLGSFVKSIGKGIKKIVKSPIGKAAILGFGANALMPGGLSSLFGSGSFNPLLRKTLGGDFAQSQFGSLLSGAKNFLGSNVGKLVAGATAGKLFGDMEPQQIQALKGDPEALRQYLEQYYDNLNLPSVDTSNPNEMAAYDTKKEDFLNRNMKAGGGRMGYNQGTSEMGIMQMASAPDPMDERNMVMETIAMQEFGKPLSDLNEDEIIQIEIFMEEMDTYGSSSIMDKYKRYIQEMINTGNKPLDFEEFKKMIEESERNMAAFGGRMGYAEGMKDPTYTGNNKEDLPRGLQIDTTTSNPMPKEKSLKENFDFVKETKGGVSPSTTMYMLKKYMDEALEKGQITKKQHIEMLMPFFGKFSEGITRDYERYEQSMANGGRINRAYGSDELVEKASGIEGLDININPKGVKELDLRETGGFIPPVGVKEKADDIPAMLSNNEFVFTADAVRAAGGGSVNKGAQIMYDTMKKLENGGTV
jgi:hypothetical protein